MLRSARLAWVSGELGRVVVVAVGVVVFGEGFVAAGRIGGGIVVVIFSPSIYVILVLNRSCWREVVVEYAM